MTISAAERKQEKEDLLKSLVVRLGDQMFTDERFREADFPAVSPTTWHSLYEKEELRRDRERGTNCFWLTPKGWKSGLELTQRIKDPELIERLSRICEAAKRHVKGRRDGALVYGPELATEANVPLGWMANAIRSELIEEVFNQVGISFAEGMYVRIPIDVGFKLE